jgi:hypothetical protein
MLQQHEWNVWKHESCTELDLLCTLQKPLSRKIPPQCLRQFIAVLVLSSAEDSEASSSCHLFGAHIYDEVHSRNKRLVCCLTILPHLQLRDLQQLDVNTTDRSRCSPASRRPITVIPGEVEARRIDCWRDPTARSKRAKAV